MNADLVPEHALVADIGCDHGYVSIYLASRHQCDTVIAMDIGSGPLSIARDNINKAGLSNKIQCRISDGLTALSPGEVDTVLIAGMGGGLIRDILKKSPDILKRVHTLVLQPQSEPELVRSAIWDMGFCIRDEVCCVDAGKYYIAICALPGDEQPPYTPEECVYGRKLLEREDPLYIEYLHAKKDKLELVFDSLREVDTDSARARCEDLGHDIDVIRRCLDGKNIV